jgi:acetylornithine deacetylase/succinyl-diaminopimelate desuccinylase-like protein
MTDTEALVRDTIEICSVAAPTGREGRRAGLVLRRLTERGVPTRIDSAGNVVGEIPGDPHLPCVALVAHLDTVFPDEGEIAVEESGGCLRAPGVGDNSAGVAALLNLARDLPREGIGRVLLVATVGEEGNGDLLGSRYFTAMRGSEIDAFVAVEGAMRDRIVTAGTGIERIRFTVSGPGGHSWGHAENPSAIEAAARIVTALYGLPLPPEPRTTLNVGTIRGGQSVNSVAAEAILDVDLRSLTQEAVDGLKRAALSAVRALFPEDGTLSLDREEIGSRPAGRLADGHSLTTHVQEARRSVGLDPAEPIASSTDANIPLAEGIPACAVGIALGEDVHRRTESLRIEGMAVGYAALLAAARRIAADTGLKRG